MLAHAPHSRPSPLPLPAALLADELGPVVMADDPCEAALSAEDPTGPKKYYRARYYDPKIGRFISEDPIGFYGGHNFYGYVANNPIRFTDPRGLDNPRCDAVPDWLEGDVELGCCRDHDECYFNNGCGAGSWATTPLPCELQTKKMAACGSCNTQAVMCVVTRRPPPPGPGCFDAKSGKRVPCPPPDWTPPPPPRNPRPPSPPPPSWSQNCWTDPKTGRTYCYAPV